MGNNQGNFQLHRFTGRENTAKKFFWGATFSTHTVETCNQASTVTDLLMSLVYLVLGHLAHGLLLFKALLLTSKFVDVIGSLVGLIYL